MQPAVEQRNLHPKWETDLPNPREKKTYPEFYHFQNIILLIWIGELSSNDCRCEAKFGMHIAIKSYRSIFIYCNKLY